MKKEVKILIIDDDYIPREFMKLLLKRNYKNISIIEAENGLDGLEKFKEEGDIDLILLNGLMPIMSGMEFLKIFRADENNKDMPIIFLSGSEDLVEKALDLGANKSIRSPFKESLFVSAIDELLFDK